jgi:ferredoxin
MKLLFLYFSGTGNTDYVAHYLARHAALRLDGSALEIELRPMEWQPAGAVTDFDLLSFGFPVYAGDSPKFVQAYLAQLPAGEGRGAFVFCTKGAYAAGAVRLNLQRLAMRGYAPLAGQSILMPGTDGLSMVSKGSWMARKALEKDYDHLDEADRLAERMAAVLSEVQGGRPAETLRMSLPSQPKPTLPDRIWAYLYKLTEDYTRSRLRTDEQCTGCGLCARICPVNNVEMRDGSPRFSEHCVLCLRCLHACPQEAIQIGKITMGKFRWRGPKGDFQPLRMRPQSGDP